ncbi:hypothetical protein RUMOBE_00039 [Blautia obeum ATCC 29174]|uniref:Uncharacterized protein n=1 Tax=Blautia obeum ATCC 29174 TaxID=411459 RepID=A5ZM22_9FIRM|nr:hypothetical protein RUMOBE_00039 [Blautia obeum ATCC 29174]
MILLSIGAVKIKVTKSFSEPCYRYQQHRDAEFH